MSRASGIASLVRRIFDAMAARRLDRSLTRRKRRSMSRAQRDVGGEVPPLDSPFAIGPHEDPGRAIWRFIGLRRPWP